MPKRKSGAKTKSQAEEPRPAGEAPEPQAGAGEQEPIDELARLRIRLEEAEAQAAEYLDGWQRAQAEFANFKKRQEADRGQMAALASADVLRKLLPLADDFERARVTLPDNMSRLTWCDGFFLMHLKLDAILESEGVKPIDAVGQAFDPLYHEAISYEEVPGYEDGQVISEVQRGYTLGDRVLRPAVVRVAKASGARPEDGGASQKSEE